MVKASLDERIFGPRCRVKFACPANGAGSGWPNQNFNYSSIHELREAREQHRPAWHGGISNGTYTVLGATNLISLPVNWTAIATNSFDASGRFSLTDSVNPSLDRQFYTLKTAAALREPNASLWIPSWGAWMGAYPSGGSASSYSNLESEIGRKLDIYRIYHPPSPAYTALSAEELNYITNGNKMLISYHITNWVQASGGNSTMNSQFASLAQSVASVKPRKIMFCITHEPEPGVGKYGTTNDYVKMWHNVRSIFDANGATNVIWTWIIENNPTFYNLLPGLWPGNSYVDWVGYDVYQSSATEDYVARQVSAYDWLVANSTATCSWTNKPWAWTEWGVGLNSYIPTTGQEAAGISNISVTINNCEFPNVIYTAYFHANALASNAMLTFSNYANTPYMQAQ
jgi:hypothetical protein